MTHTTNTKKAAGASNTSGLHTNTNGADFRPAGAIEQAHDTKAIATPLAHLELAGHHVIKAQSGDYTVCKFGLTTYCKNFAELAAFAQKVGAA